MSAINDALRRASSAAKTPAGTPGQQPFPPANEPPSSEASAPEAIAAPPIIATPGSSLPPVIESAKKKSKLPLIFGLLFVFCLAGGAAFYFFGKGRLVALARETTENHNEPSGKEQLAALFGDPKVAGKITTENGSSNQVATKPQPPVAPVAPEPAPKAAAPVAAAVPRTTSTSQSAAAPRGAVPFPPLRLQSIFYRTGNPSVMINGKTLFVGDEINGVLIADIQPSNVTLVLSGQTNVLTLR